MADLTRAAAILARFVANRPRLHAALDDQAEDGIRAQDYTPSTRPASLDPDPDGPPPRPDPTGETAVHGDRARRLRAELDQAEARLLAAIRTLQRTPHPAPRLDQVPAVVKALAQVRRNDPTWHRARTSIDSATQTIWRIAVEVLDPLPPKPADLAHLARDGEPGCQCCARASGWWNSPDYNSGRPTDLGGRLPEAWLICRACYRFTITVDRPPTVKELEHRRKDPRARWPKRYDTAAA